VDARARRGSGGDPRLDLAALRVLVVNAGSTSLKLRLVAADDATDELGRLEDAVGSVDAVAHRIVHGGERFREPVLIDAGVRERIEELVELAPLHNAPAWQALQEAEQVFLDVPQVAVFDTGFHATMPAEAFVYAVPTAWNVRRFGFHGLSVQWASEQVRVPRLVVCHLGGGCSVTAVRDGRSVDTTMGFTPLEGVPMATRSGSIDPGAILHLLRQGIGVDELDDALNEASGLTALAGTGDMRELERRDDDEARLALSVFSYRVAAAAAAMAAACGGVDALVFTAGIGEGSALVRRLVCERLSFLGVELDLDRNEGCEPDCDVGAAAASARVVVVRAREEIVAARAARAVLAGA
jgi:acetate kinase